MMLHILCSNACHGSDKVETAKKEIEMWFEGEELISWDASSDQWVYECQ